MTPRRLNTGPDRHGRRNDGAMYNPVVGKNVETGKIFARKVWLCGYCGKKYSGGRCRCPQCHSRKLAGSA